MLDEHSYTTIISQSSYDRKLYFSNLIKFKIALTLFVCAQLKELVHISSESKNSLHYVYKLEIENTIMEHKWMWMCEMQQLFENVKCISRRFMHQWDFCVHK